MKFRMIFESPIRNIERLKITSLLVLNIGASLQKEEDGAGPHLAPHPQSAEETVTSSMKR